MFEPIANNLPASEHLGQPSVMNQGVVNNVFKVLHGAYGNLFLMKYATGQLACSGEVDATGQSIDGQDKGILNARQIWAHGLREFDASTVKTALKQAMDRTPEFPPSLPQFIAICTANKPREVCKPELPAVGMGTAIRSQYAAQAREIHARHIQQVMQSRSVMAASISGLGGLMQAIASAVANAGGDEVAELKRLEAMLTPKNAVEATFPQSKPTKSKNARF